MISQMEEREDTGLLQLGLYLAVAQHRRNRLEYFSNVLSSVSRVDPGEQAESRDDPGKEGLVAFHGETFHKSGDNVVVDPAVALTSSNQKQTLCDLLQSPSLQH